MKGRDPFGVKLTFPQLSTPVLDLFCAWRETIALLAGLVERDQLASGGQWAGQRVGK